MLAFSAWILARKKEEALTHFSLVSYLWDIGKQYSPKFDTAERGVPSGAILFAKRMKFKITPDASKNYCGHPSLSFALLPSIQHTTFRHKTCNVASICAVRNLVASGLNQRREGILTHDNMEIGFPNFMKL